MTPGEKLLAQVCQDEEIWAALLGRCEASDQLKESFNDPELVQIIQNLLKEKLDSDSNASAELKAALHRLFDQVQANRLIEAIPEFIRLVDLFECPLPDEIKM